MCELLHLEKKLLPLVVRQFLHHTCRMREGDQSAGLDPVHANIIHLVKEAYH